MAKKRSSTTKKSTEAIIEQAASVSFQNLGVEWKPKPDGSAELLVAYDGPLATRNEVIARAGTWREGSGPWAETRELPLRRQGTRWVGTIPVASGATVQAVEFVFRANDEWDNGGRAPLGYYEWNPRERRVEVR
ncbi:MAG TPA: hypothetical protein VLC54_09215 [Anaeromyxobacter sp.]|nr:hypothetical protein [Anaeromyxobacter sp.]